MASERVLNHADAEQIATKLETAAGLTPGTNDGNNGKLPSHADGERINAAIQALANKGAFSSGHVVVDKNNTQHANRAKLKFTGDVTVTDDSENNQTIVNVTGGGGGSIGTFVFNQGTRHLDIIGGDLTYTYDPTTRHLDIS